MCSRTVVAGSWLKLLATLQLSRNHAVETGGINAENAEV